MVNFWDTKPQKHFPHIKVMSQRVLEKSWTMRLMAEYANTTLLLACLFDMDIQESLV